MPTTPTLTSNNDHQGGTNSINDPVLVDMKPYPLPIPWSKTALIMIDMQADFLNEGGFGEALGNDVSQLRKAIPPCQALLEAARNCGLTILHTREGHRPDLSDLHPHKRHRPGSRQPTIGQPGPFGRILVRGEPGHDIISDLYPLPTETVIDKPGKGSFYATDLECILRAQNITTLLVCGVTTEVCVHTTVREANDRGYHCIVIEDACASYTPHFHDVAIEMVWKQGGLFGSVTDSTSLIQAMMKKQPTKKKDEEDAPEPEPASKKARQT